MQHGMSILAGASLAWGHAIFALCTSLALATLVGQQHSPPIERYLPHNPVGLCLLGETNPISFG